MTMKQARAIKLLPKNGYNVGKSLREAGYSKSSSRAGSQYRALRNYTKRKGIDFFDPEKIKKDIKSTFRMAKKAKDVTNMSRINEHRAKIAQMITDKSEVSSQVTIKESEKQELNQIRNRILPIEAQ